jgi:hypothetical protein
MPAIRRAPRYHHYWLILQTMPPTKHTRKPGSPLIKWITTRTGCDTETARLAFESAKQARYLIQHDGKWQPSPNEGFDHWNKKPGGKEQPQEAPPQPQDAPEDERSAEDLDEIKRMIHKLALAEIKPLLPCSKHDAFKVVQADHGTERARSIMLELLALGYLAFDGSMLHMGEEEPS